LFGPFAPEGQHVSLNGLPAPLIDQGKTAKMCGIVPAAHSEQAIQEGACVQDIDEDGRRPHPAAQEGAQTRVGLLEVVGEHDVQVVNPCSSNRPPRRVPSWCMVRPKQTSTSLRRAS